MMGLVARLADLLRRDRADAAQDARTAETVARAHAVARRLEERRRWWDRRAEEVRRAALFADRRRGS